jgi:hypothetical protein
MPTKVKEAPSEAIPAKPAAAPIPIPPKKGGPIILPALDIRRFRLTLVGETSLICHAWSEKAKKEMRDKQFKNPKQAKEAKDPESDFRASLYVHPDGGYGFPSIAFKASAVDACSHVSGVTKVEARGAFHIDGELVKIDGEPTSREDMVKIPSTGSADLRYRGEFLKWSTTFTVKYNANVLSDAQIVNLFNTAGFAIGVGEWRPQRDGMHGMFSVKRGVDGGK